MKVLLLLASFRSLRKIVNLDDHTALACAGLKADACVRKNMAHIECRSHNLAIEDLVQLNASLGTLLASAKVLTKWCGETLWSF